MKKILLYLLLPLLASCYQEKECPDISDPEFPANTLEWFSFQVGDTLHFEDRGGKTYELICSSRTEDWDSSFYDNYKCVNGGSFIIHPSISFSFISDFPHFSNKNLNLILKITGSPNSNARIKFNTNDQLNYEYYFVYKPENNEIISYDDYVTDIAYINKTTINETSYAGVYKLNKGDLPEGSAEFYYDTIYYNKDGFLKFISSKYGYRLERLP
ncbi:MAG: hypothetical protein JW801_04185 [Bacteroidales bacterium]|nr:hypothetical protein [Bacteroidales bacterium]